MAEPGTIETSGRTVGTSTSGIDIVRKFHIENYEDHVDVLKTLRGFVDQDGKRHLPARDPYIPSCFCTEASSDLIDPDAMVTAGSISTEASLIDKLEKKASPLTGANITARYRPLITAWDSKDASKPDDDRFDWMDPKYVAGVRQIAWPDGLYISNGVDVDSVPQEAGQAYTVAITKFSIRRILVGSVPWHTIDQSLGTVNIVNFPGKLHETFKNLPDFEPRTLKFVGAEVETMIDSKGNRWYEIVYNFEWISTYTDTLFSVDGVKSEGAVTWNHVFTNTSFLGWPTGETGWYEVFVGKQFRVNGFVIPAFGFGGLQLSGGRLHIEAKFLDLFDPNAK